MTTAIRFNNLKNLIQDMGKENRTIEAFPFTYNQKQYAVILTRYKPNETKPSQHARAKLEFFNLNNEKSIFAYADYYEVYFQNATDFINFFEIKVNGGKTEIRQIFENFSKIFAGYIPIQVNKNLDSIYKKVISNRLEPNSPDAIYCYDVRRNGKDKYGNPNHRSRENSEKAKILRPQLYQIFKADTNYSFFFSDKPQDEKSDKEIIQQVTKR